MKIGILTWFFGNNYGARAHTYALRNVISEMGYECEFVNYIPRKGFIINVLSNLNAGNPLKHPVRTINCLIRCLKFYKAKKLNPCGKRVHNGKELDEIRYDAVVIGSDAILNIHHPQFESIYYGDGILKTPFFTYAPSCEYMKSGDKLSFELSQGINNAVALSARDEVTKKVLERITGKQVCKVLDPAFLYDFSDLSKSLNETNYLLIYSFSEWEQYSRPIIKYAKDHKLKIVSVGRYCSWADKSYDAASFYEWIGAFENASLVFTDSFHGVVFAVKNRKPILAAARLDKEYKIKDLMETIGVRKFNFFSGSDVEEYLKSQTLDYDEIKSILNEKVAESMKFLGDAIYLTDRGRKQ